MRHSESKASTPGERTNVVAVESGKSAYPSDPASGEMCDDLDLIPYLLKMVQVEEMRSDFLMRVVIPLGAELVQETDYNHLLERILLSAMAMSRADGGALYLRQEDDSLRIALFRRESLGIAMGGASGNLACFPPISLAEINAGDKLAPIAARAVLTGQSISELRETAPSYATADVSGAARFDREIGFRIYSSLAVPLRGVDGLVAGAIELSNARREGGCKPVPFETAIRRAIEALALLAAAALQSYLKQEQLRYQVRELRVQVDGAKKMRQVDEIVRTDYFQALKARARDLRKTLNSPIREPLHPSPPSDGDRS